MPDSAWGKPSMSNPPMQPHIRTYPSELHQIKFRSICAMLRFVIIIRYIGCLLLDPPIQFGRQHSYQTCCRENFASVAMCRLTSTMRHFRFAASTWWNSLSTHIHDDNVNFINVVRKFYLDDCLSSFFCVLCCSYIFMLL